MRHLVIHHLLFGAMMMSSCSSKVTHANDGREQLMVALGLEKLPSSVRNISFGEDSWTDYMVHVYCEVDPVDFKLLMAGRNFNPASDDPFGGGSPAPFKIHPPDYAGSIPVFDAEETYSWSDGHSMSCKVFTTKKHDRIYAVYGAGG